MEIKRREKLIYIISYSAFYIGLIIEVLMVIVDKSNYINPIEGQLFRLTFLLFLIKACLTRYSKREYLVIAFFGLLGMLIYFVARRNDAVRIAVFVIACKEIDMQKSLKMVFYETLTGCVAIILLAVMGIYGAVSLTMDYGRGYVETRYTLGMGHPNALQCMVWALTTLGLYLYGAKMKWYHYLEVFILNFIFFLLTDSRTSLVVTTYTIALAYLMSYSGYRIKKISAWIGGFVTIFSIGMSIVIAGNAYRVYNYVWNMDRAPVTRFFVQLNNVLNGRIRILVENDRFEGTISTWKLFSGPENNYFFDMGWVRLFYWYGIFPASVFILILIIVLIYCYQKRQYYAIMLISSFALYSVIEAHAVSVYLARNYVLFIVGMLWSQIVCYKGETQVENKKKDY